MSSSGHHYHFDISMSCGGCSGAVDRVLKKLDGIDHYTVSLDTQSADVYTTADSGLKYGQTLSKIHKTGKKINAGKEDGQERSVNPADFGLE